MASSIFGAEVWITKPITMRDFKEMCKYIGSNMSEYKVEDFLCPEGGFTGDIDLYNGDIYKSIRFHIQNRHSDYHYRGARSRLLDRREGLEQIWAGRDWLANKRNKYINKIDMYLRKSENSPSWTKEELNIVITALENYGCKVVKRNKL